jgi:hypothetical protein
MFTPFDQLRTEAATLRDDRIKAAQEQHREVCRRIDDLERSLTNGVTHSTKIHRPVVSYVQQIICDGEPFTMASLWKAVQERFPYWRTNYSQIKRCVYRMMKRGEIERAGFDDQRCGVYVFKGQD